MLRRTLNRLLLALLLMQTQNANAQVEDVPPEPMPPNLELVIPESATPAYQRPNHERRDLPEEGQQFIRSIALILLPQKFDDDDGWGDEKRIQSGLNVDIKRGKLHTSRQWNNVNHGTWLRGSGELVEPETLFTLKATQLPDPDEKSQRYEVRVSSRLFVRGQQQQWNYGVMLWSVSADATADISLQATIDVRTDVVTTEKGSRLRFVPNVTQASANLDNFKLHRISHARGTSVKGIGELVEELIQLRIRKENKDLAARINKAIQKKPERLEIPFDLGGWFGVSPKKATP